MVEKLAKSRYAKAALVVAICIVVSAGGAMMMRDSNKPTANIEQSTTTSTSQSSISSSSASPALAKLNNGSYSAFITAVDLNSDPPRLTFDLLTRFEGKEAVDKLTADSVIPHMYDTLQSEGLDEELLQRAVDRYIYFKNEDRTRADIAVKEDVTFKYFDTSRSPGQPIDPHQLTVGGWVYAINPNDTATGDIISGEATLADLADAVVRSQELEIKNVERLTLAPLSEVSGTVFTMTVMDNVVVGLRPVPDLDMTESGVSQSVIVYNTWVDSLFADESKKLPIPGGVYTADTLKFVSDSASTSVEFSLFTLQGVAHEADTYVGNGVVHTLPLAENAKFELSLLGNRKDFVSLAEMKEALRSGYRDETGTLIDAPTKFQVTIDKGQITMISNLKFD